MNGSSLTLHAVLTFSAIGLALGILAGYLLFRWYRNFTLKGAHTEAEEILDQTKEFLEIKLLEQNEKKQEIELESWNQVEKDFLKLEERIEEITERLEEKENKHRTELSEKHKIQQLKEQEVRRLEQSLRAREENQSQWRNKVTSLNRELSIQLSARSQISIEQCQTDLAQQMEADTKLWAQTWIDHQFQEVTEHAETKAKGILDIVLDRFMRPYSAERGIGAVHFPDPEIKKIFSKNLNENIKTLQEVCGCDIIVEEDQDLIGVAGYDPVRRELTRRTLEKVLKERKNIHPDQIRRIAENQKRELFKQIRHDGDLIARELKLENLHPEIKQMMGSLRYRYSFTQNQYFHCGEVGWLCGLLSSELRISSAIGRRSGLLHDIGKSMDHVQEGGHAVIGADFIAARGESPEVIHNVRAHHYDEAPNSDHAFLVIAADAISGARPGARRSTIESYNQKVTVLQDIARSFDGVTDCIILNGGRECRVLVNGKRIDDSTSLDLSHKIARKIEEECSYPGQIKIVVVRETIVSETTQKY